MAILPRFARGGPASSHGGKVRGVGLCATVGLMVERVLATAAALDLIERLRLAIRAVDVPSVGRLLRRLGADGLPKGEFRVGGNDVHLRDGGARSYGRRPVRLLEAHPPDHRCRAGPRLGLLLEAPEGVRFLTRSRVFTDEEVDALAAV